jgi:AraC-like DNA-binding protein
MVAKVGCQIDLMNEVAVRADLERFAIEALIAGDPARPARGSSPQVLVQVPELRTVPVHWHDYYELGYVLEGAAVHVVNGRRERIGPGSAFLLSPVDFHEIEVPPGRTLRCVNVVVSPGLVEDTLQSVIPDSEEWLPWTTGLEDHVAEVQRVVDETEHRGPGWGLVVESSVRQLLIELARRCSPAIGGADPAVRRGGAADVARAVRYVERHFREPLTLADVAAVAHLSPHWFSEQFRNATGTSFQAYLKGRRLQFARALLQATDLSVTEVCHAAGFNDLSWFGRAYRRRYGEPPSRRC